jgi:Icc-related predicted phosphoesterase
MTFGKSSGNRLKMIRILYGSDFHGSEAVFRKFISAALQYQANALIVGGDVTGKAMIPIIHQNDGKYVGYLFGRREEATTQEELERFKKNIRNVGFYPIILQPEEADELENDKDKMAKRFEHEMKERIREWMELAQEKLLPQSIEFYFMPGNDDLYSIDQVIDEYPFVRNPDMKHFYLLGEYEIVGLSNANMTPWACARDVEESELETRLNELSKMIENPEKTIAVIHVPPFASQLDTCPELDRDLRIVTQGGQIMMKSAGSRAVRSFIERVQPLLSLHGHIHESPGHARIGRTLAINAGSEYTEGIMKAAIINLEGGRIKGHLLISG